MAVRGRGSLKKLQDKATLSKAELTKLEKEAEKKSAARQKKNRGRSRREIAKRTAIPKAVKQLMISKEQDAKNKGDARLKAENRTGNPTGTRGPQKPAPKGTLSQITKTAADGLKLAKKLARATGVLGLLSAEKLGDGSLYKGKSEAEVSRIIEQKAKSAKREQQKQDKKRVDTATKARKTKNYNVGVSKGGVSFKEAFAHFRKKGAKTFTWNGEKYTTEIK